MGQECGNVEFAPLTLFSKDRHIDCKLLKKTISCPPSSMKTCYFKILLVQLISKNLRMLALPLLLIELNKGVPYLEKKTREGEILFISTEHEETRYSC